jgi:hypothetical protein
VAQVLCVDFWNRQSVAAKMPGELKESDILLSHRIQNADGAESSAGEPHDSAPRGSEFALKRPHLFGGQLVMLLKKLFENVHKHDSQGFGFDESSKRPKNISALPLNQPDHVLETAVAHFDRLIYDVGLVSPSHYKDNIERPIQER